MVAGFVGSEMELAGGVSLLVDNAVVIEYLLEEKVMLACDARQMSIVEGGCVAYVHRR